MFKALYAWPYLNIYISLHLNANDNAVQLGINNKKKHKHVKNIIVSKWHTS